MAFDSELSPAVLSFGEGQGPVRFSIVLQKSVAKSVWSGSAKYSVSSCDEATVMPQPEQPGIAAV